MVQPLPRPVRALVLSATLAAIPDLAHAQLSQGPDGRWSYTNAIQSSGEFRCTGMPVFMPGITCTATGNSVLLEQGSRSVSIVFHGVNALSTFHPSEWIPVDLGDFEVHFTGTPSDAFPLVRAPIVPLFRFVLTAQLGGGASRDVSFGAYTDPGGTGLETGATLTFAPYGDFSLFVPYADPATRKWGGLAFTPAAPPVLPAADGRSTVFRYSATLMPEPATLALTAGGLLVLAGVARRRRAS